MHNIPHYTVTRKRMKTMRLTVVAPHGDVRVSAPRHVPDSTIAAFVAEKADWIVKHRERIASQPVPLDSGPETERLRTQFKQALPPLVEFWARQMGVPIPEVAVRRMTTRWGTCNTVTRRVTLNLELGRRDPQLLEYVIVHELAHLLERGHNDRFYAIMDAHLPDWRLRRRVLNGMSAAA